MLEFHVIPVFLVLSHPVEVLLYDLGGAALQSLPGFFIFRSPLPPRSFDFVGLLVVNLHSHLTDFMFVFVLSVDLR